MSSVTRTIRLAAALALLSVAGLAAQSYHLVRRDTLGGDGGWDYLALDSVGHRLFIARQDRVMVVDQMQGRLLAEIPGLDRAHGVAFDQEAGRGYATSGGDGMVVMFDLKSLAVLGKTAAAPDADAILFDPGTKRVFTFNGDAGTSSVLDGATGRSVGTVQLGGKPEFGVSAGNGRLYANIEDQGQVVEIDAAAMQVTRRWSIAPCQSPTGLAIDRAHNRLFSVCRNQLMVISDATAGKVVATVPIGRGVDGARFDAGTDLAFASNGEGTLTVVREETPDSFTVVANVPTLRGARTLELDPVTHRVYTVSAEYGPPPAPAADGSRRRPAIVPGTFSLLVLEP